METVDRLKKWIADCRAYADTQRRLAAEDPRIARIYLDRAMLSEERATAYAVRLGNIIGEDALAGTAV